MRQFNRFWSILSAWAPFGSTVFVLSLIHKIMSLDMCMDSMLRLK